MIERKYNVYIYFSEILDFDEGGLERELGASPSYIGRRVVSLLDGPSSCWSVEYEGLKDSKALQIIKWFSDSETLNNIILNPTPDIEDKGLFSFKTSHHPSQQAIHDIRA